MIFKSINNVVSLSVSTTYYTEVGLGIYLRGCAPDYCVDPVYFCLWSQDDGLAGVDESHCIASYHCAANPYPVDHVRFITKVFIRFGATSTLEN